MNKTELLNRAAGGDGELRILLARVLDKLELAQQRNVPARTDFLSPAQRAAVEDLLNCPEIDLYMEIPLDAIASLNDLLGGVTVTLMDDFTMADSAMKEGATLTLTGEQAMTLVRRRIDVADGTNEARMTRQRIFMDAAIPKIREKIDESSGFVTTMIDTLSPYLTTNMARGRMINEINRAYHYEVEPVQYLTGEHSIGEDGFMEFHADEQSIVDFVLDAFYTKQE